MKTVKLRPHLIPSILSGHKTSTWRLFDDKDLQVGDDIQLLEFGTLKPIAIAKITDVTLKQFKGLNEEDWKGHHRYESDAEMYDTFSGYYGQPVGPDTEVKVIHFELKH